MSAPYATTSGLARADFDVFMPGRSDKDLERCRTAGIPGGLKRKTKPQLARHGAPRRDRGQTSAALTAAGVMCTRSSAPPARADMNAISTFYEPGSERAADTANAAVQLQNAALCTTITAERPRLKTNQNWAGMCAFIKSSSHRRRSRLRGQMSGSAVYLCSAAVGANARTCRG